MKPLTKKIDDLEKAVKAKVIYGNAYRGHFWHEIFLELVDSLGSQAFQLLYLKLNEKTF